MAEPARSPVVSLRKNTSGKLAGILHDALRSPISLAATALLAVALWSALILGLWQSRQAEIDRARSTAANLARLLNEQTYRVFQTADITLQHVSEHLKVLPGTPAHDKALRGYLRSIVADMPYIGALFVVGPDGFIVHNTDDPSTASDSLADRGYFAVHRNEPHLGLYIDRPLRSRATPVGAWFVPLSRRLENADGSFAGTVVAAIEPKFFDAFYRELRLGKNDAIALYGLDTTLIARFPELPEVIGQPWPESPVFLRFADEPDQGTFVAPNRSGIESIGAYRRIEGYPLVTSVGLSLSDILTGWRRYAIVMTAGLACATVLIFATYFLAMRRRIERAVARRNAMHLQKMEALARMTSTVAHDFNNILAVAASSLTLIRKHGAQAQFLDAGERAIASGRRLTQQLLEFAKRRELHPSVENPNTLLRALEPVIRHTAGERVSVTLSLAEDELLCLADRAQFESAITNLVINAAQAMPGGGNILVATRRRVVRDHPSLASGTFVSVRITDTGTGIAATDLQHIFEPFFTTKQEHGTGLGLLQVSDFMKRVGGDIEVESAVGHGTTFELLFPCIEAADAAAQARARG